MWFGCNKVNFRNCHLKVLTVVNKMYTLSVNVCRYMSPRGAYRLIHCSIPSCKVIRYDVPYDPQNFTPLRGTKMDIFKSPVTQALKYLNEEKVNGSIRWDVVHSKLLKDVKNPTPKILQACVRLGEVKYAVSYYEHLTGNGQKLEKIDLMIFSKLLNQDKELVLVYKDVLLKLYKDLKEEMFSSQCIWNFMLEVFVEIPECYYEISETLMKEGYKELVPYCDPLIIKSLKLNHFDVAMNLMRRFYFKPNENFLEAYIEFCIKRLKENTFSVELITTLVEILEKKVVYFGCSDFKSVFNVLLEALEKYDNKYNWSFSECTINPKTTSCSNCKLTLQSKSPTEQEYAALKQNFLERFFENKSIYINSSTEEFKSFMKFLETSRPYNIVLDGLNLMYKKKNIGLQLSNRYLKFFLENGFRVLTVGRIHGKPILLKAYNVIPNKHKDKVQFFFTANLSDDDVFVLYAALHGGLNTYFLSGDNLGTYAPALGDEMRAVYIKWQLTHQYMITPELQLDLPVTHCNLSQLTARPNSKHPSYVWHLSNSPGKGGLVTRSGTAEWYCLQAIRKK